MTERTESDETLMRRGLRLARLGRGCVEPNPMVGCVLARGGRVMAEGWHARFGCPHGEADALAKCREAGADPEGCDVFVTLEPCDHQGKTPPCTEALIDAKVGRVVVAMTDPNPQVAGQGIARLREAGIKVEVGLCEDDALQLNEAYIKRVTTGLPWVIVKWAQTLDGRIATATGDSRWISGDASRRLVHRVRARVDAVMVGIGTALADDPQLTARDTTIRRAARRVVVDPELRLPVSSKLVESLQQGGDAPPITVACGEGMKTSDAFAALGARSVELFTLPALEGEGRRLSLRPLLEHLAKAHSATNVVVEGGAALIGSLYQEGLVDQVMAFVAPKLIGDSAALGAVTGLDCDDIDDALRLRLRGTRRLGDDVLLDYRVGLRT